MKKPLLFLSSLILLTCCSNVDNKKPSLSYIELSGEYQTTFFKNDTFNYDGLVVTAFYNDQSSKVVDNYQISNPDMSVLGEQSVIVTYKNKSESYSINVYESQEEIPYPLNDALNFLASRGVTTSMDIIPSSISSLTGVLQAEAIEDDDCPRFQVVIDNDNNYETVINQLSGLGFNLVDGIYIDQNETIGLEISKCGENLVVCLYAYNDLIVVPPDEDGTYVSDDFPLQDAEYIGKPKSDQLEENGPYSFRDFNFDFHKNDSKYAPKSNKSTNIQLYIQNTFVVTAVNADYQIRKIELTTGDENDEIVSNVGVINQTSSKVIWTGSSNEVIFTVIGKQYKFTNVNIYYFKPTEFIPPAGIKTISELQEIAKTLTFRGSNGYLVNDTYEVQVNLKAIDAIDSFTTSGLPGNARGKVLCVDETGYIIVSSGVSSANPIDFYQRVKDYIKQATTTYYVTGHLAKFNDVLEINVDTYQYVSTLSIKYDLNDYLSSDSVNSSAAFMNHCKTILANKNGYGVGEIIRMNGLTYFNKYRKAGSYYFLDREGDLVPVYSLLDKDRSSLMLGNTYDIIGLESLYNGRPSLRILEVIHSDLDSVEYDLSKAIEKTDMSYFYNINPNKTDYLEKYYNSVTVVYKMDVYVSRYTDDDYTFNVSYHYDRVNKEFTTGNSQVDAANHNSLGMSNENLDYNETFYDYALELAESEEEIEQYKVTIYFTLALLKTVSGKEMWYANIFEDYVPQLGV